MPSSLLNTFRLLAPLGIELVGLRFFLHQVLQLHPGFPGFTDYELLLPAPLGFLAFLWAAEKEKALSFLFSLKKLMLHLVALIVFLGLSVLLKNFSTPLISTLWWTALTFLCASGLLLFVDVTALMKTERLYSLLPALAMALSLVIYFKWGGRLFENTITVWAACLESVCKFFGLSNVEVFPFSKMVQVYHPRWAIHIGRGCAGFDSLIFFMGAFGVFAPLYWKEYRPGQWGVFFLVGLGLFTFLNFFRILFLFLVGLFLMKWMPAQKAISLTLTLFHVHLGYLLYGLGLFSYFQFILALKSFSFESVKNLPLLKRGLTQTRERSLVNS